MNMNARKKRIDHINKYIENCERDNVAVDNIERGVGNRSFCAMSLSSCAVARAMSAWFVKGEIGEFRQWMYLAAKLDQFWYKIGDQPFSPLANMLNLLNPLISNNLDLIHWFANFEPAYDKERVEKPNTSDFFAYQAVIAIQGNWGRLEARCDKMLSNFPTSAKHKNYIHDYEFYLALARGDNEEMRRAITKLLGENIVKSRCADETAFSKDLIFTPAVIYSKIASLHGYDLNMESDYIPLPWMGNVPLDYYDNYYSFLK